MAIIFLSYRRTDGPQACRVREWLTRRLGAEAVFMDVENIPVAVSFPDYIKTEIERAHLLLALVGSNWVERINQPGDQVRPEIENALAKNIPVLPVLIGNTPMPNPDQLPPSIASIARQNAPTVGVLNDFETHMRALMPWIESILVSLSSDSIVTSNPEILTRACAGITLFLRESFSSYLPSPEWRVIGTAGVANPNYSGNMVGLYLHRVVRLPESLQLHFILSIWADDVSYEQSVAGWIIRQLEQHPVIPEKFFLRALEDLNLQLKIRRSDEDPRAIWKMITDQPLRLSLAYVATVSPK